MKNILFLLFCLLSISACKTGQKTIETPQTFAPTAAEKTLLWQISGKDLTQNSYVYGTIHMIDEKDYFLTDSTRAAFNRTEKVVFEINMNEMNDPSVMLSLFTKAMMGNGMTLKDLLSEEDYTLVNEHFTELGLPMFMLDRVKPMFLSMMASGDLSGEGGLQGGGVKSYEMEFMKMAEEQNKETDGLETLAFQLSVFDSIPYPEQATILMNTLKAGDEGLAEYDKMIQHYKDQDIAAMYNMFESESETPTNFESVLLTNRNQNWVPVMEKMMLGKPTFFAVGAGHLGGDDGVIALLRKAGYTLRPIFNRRSN